MRLGSRALLAVPVLFASSCGGDPSILDPAGPEAERLADLWWFMLAVGTAVWVLVVLTLLAATRRRGRGAAPPRWSGTPLVVAGGIVLPVVVLVPFLAVVLAVASGDGDAAHSGGHGATAAEAGDLVIEVTGHQFWWEVVYPDTPGGVAVTANEVHVPVGRPVTVVLGSEDVIHSFWVPNVAGKTDLIPGETTHLRFTVDRPGAYRGVCAEFCGIQHAQMRLLLVAEPEDEFGAWLEDLTTPADAPRTPSAMVGRRTFQEVGCASCHSIRGTTAVGALGPDLTGLADRATLGAGAVPNTRGDLAGWITDPQGIKPGSRMPPQVLEPAQLHALLDYLETLE